MRTSSGALRALLFVAIAGLAQTGQAQIIEVEPNDPCPFAQSVNTVPPLTITGSLDLPPSVPGVDFFRLESAPNAVLRAELLGATSGFGTLPDPYLGLFDSDCNLVSINDDFLGLDSRLDFVVPEDGVFILAAGSCCDPDFMGNGSSAGDYVLRLAVAPPPIGSISGRVIDAVTGQSLSGIDPPFAFVQLTRCTDVACDQYVTGGNAAADGTFVFDADASGNPIEPGSFQIVGSADSYSSATVGPFVADAGEHVDVGALALAPPPVTVDLREACNDIPMEGGPCLYTIEVGNTGNETLTVLGWSLVNSGGLGSPLGYSVFPAKGSARRYQIGPQQQELIPFAFYVPGNIASGAYFCTESWLSASASSFLDTVSSRFLFCITKHDDRFVTTTKPERALLQRSPRP